MIDLYFKLEEMIDRIDFDKLWPGFHKFEFALYDDKTVFFRDYSAARNNNFFGNTAINYEGRNIAIWDIAFSMIDDTEVFASKIIHEMFHAFQYESGEKRFPNEFNGFTYYYESGRMNLKHRENRLIAQCLQLFDPCAWNEFLGIRKFRQKLYPENVLYETGIEVIEGMAQYIELSALKLLSKEKFSSTVNKIADFLSKPESLFPVRSVCYASGTLICLTCRQNGISIEHVIGKEGQTIFEMISAGCEPRNAVCNDETVNSELEKYVKYKSSLINNFKTNAANVIKGDFQLCGFDPMNTVASGNHLHCRHFVKYRDGNEEKTMQKECVLEVDEQMNIKTIYY